MYEFQSRKFQQPAIRLLRTSVKLKGSYTFEVFAYENRDLYQFHVRFLPYSDYYISRFVKSVEGLDLEDENVIEMTAIAEKVFLKYHSKWEGKKPISEWTLAFLNLLIQNHQVEIPKSVLDKIRGEIQRIFLRPDICKTDTKGRPYFSNANFGKFFIDEIGIMLPTDFERHNLKLK